MAEELKTEGVEIVKHEETKTTLEEKVIAVLCYFLGFITGIVFLMVEKENKFIRFHALQSIITFLPLTVLIIAVDKVMVLERVSPGTLGVPVFGSMIAFVIYFLLYLLLAVLWLLLMYKASHGEKYKLPMVGRLAEKYS